MVTSFGHKFLKKNYFTTFNIFTLPVLYYGISNDQPKLYCQLSSYKWETELMIFYENKACAMFMLPLAPSLYIQIF